MGAKGARVALVGRNVAKLHKTKAAIEEAGGTAEVFVTDLLKDEDIRKLAVDVQNLWGTVDILANVAAVWYNDERSYLGPLLHQTSIQEVDEVFNVGLRAAIFLCQLFIPGMIEQKRGKILNISGRFPEGGFGCMHYFISKAGLEALTSGLAAELRQYNVQVNCISPADVDSEAMYKFHPEYAEIALSTDLVADLAVYLLESVVGDQMTGQTVVIGNDTIVWDSLSEKAH